MKSKESNFISVLLSLIKEAEKKDVIKTYQGKRSFEKIKLLLERMV